MAGWLPWIQPLLQMQLVQNLWNQSISNPRNQARSASLGKGADSDSVCKEIDVEDVGAMTLCGLPAAIDSAPTPNATSPIQLGDQLIPNPRI